MLTEQQQSQYYAQEGTKARPLSPTAWLAQQTATAVPQQQPVPTPTPLTSPDGSIEATRLSSGGTPPLPQPTAPQVQEEFQTGLSASVATAEKTLTDTLIVERDAALKRQEELNKRLESILSEQDPEKRATYEQEQRVIRNQLDAAETASATLEEDFIQRRKIVSELQTLLTQGNMLIEQARNRPVALQVLNKTLTNTMQDVQARAGVLNAVITGLDGNITQAHNLINQSRAAIASIWEDIKTYNNAYLSLVESGELAKNSIHDSYAQSQVTLAENKLNTLQATADHINALMVDPESAQFIADAGITLNDSVEEINAKMAEQTRRVEIRDTKNQLAQEGYEYVPFGENRDDVVSLEVGGQTLYFKPPASMVNEWNDIDTKAVAGGGILPSSLSSLGSTDALGTDEDPMLDIIRNSAGGKSLTQSQIEPFTNGTRVLNQLDDLASSIEAQTGPITGIVRSNNPYDEKARLIKAQITALVPQLARGIYGEVGVLTDSDVERYIQTLPNIQSTEDINKAVMGMTLRNVRNAFAANIESMAAAGRDVSGFLGIYQRINEQIRTIESDLGLNATPASEEDIFDQATLGVDSPDTTSTAGSTVAGWLDTLFGEINIGGFTPFK